MSFVIGNRVWYKRAGSTPFITGNSTTAGTVYDSALAGRGDPSITFSGAQFGVPLPQFTTTFKTKVNTGVENTEHTVSGTFSFAGDTTGIFDQPTIEKLFGNQDEGASDSGNSIRTMDVNFPSGRPNAVTATGTSIPLSGSHPFVNETINVAGTTVGYRTPSSEEGAGIVIKVNSGVTVGTKSPDGTKILAGTTYWVNWGASSVSNAHRAKWNNRFRVSLHAEEELIAA